MELFYTHAQCTLHKEFYNYTQLYRDDMLSTLDPGHLRCIRLGSVAVGI